ncbi:NAD-dependent deacetylase sirtuin-2 [Meira miltonrushii]|uniref:NAD-dependent protein deacetylase n=1 Tax=Meira miltonrushii TaxID=1280837 RepID=A0A316VLI1_9BASI|nr:NAD-dependent deacetylase sirtuin-2 [Meira miltonrushii]PWN38452.1 NAD-dependent deacetylase sirtuin-2 [Meira miltonrushii]
MAGAGISTASGIPDFRSPKTGLYANLKKYNLPYPEAIFDIDYFQDKPQPFYTLSKEMWPSHFKPTLTHSFFKLLDDKKKLLRVFTQNIDTLERLAGLSEDRIVEAHGSFAQSRCIRCKKEVEQDWIRDKVMAGEVAYCPHSSCQRLQTKSSNRNACLVKPDIVFFGEGLPDKFFQSLNDLKKADLLIVVGTSLQVHPFASLVNHVKPNCPRVLLNLERVGEIASYGQKGSGMRGLMNEDGFDFEGWTLPSSKGKEHIRDVFWEGKCDEGVLQLAKELGWEDELRDLHKKTCNQLDLDNGTISEQNDKTLKKAEAEADKVANELTEQIAKLDVSQSKEEEQSEIKQTSQIPAESKGKNGPSSL